MSSIKNLLSALLVLTFFAVLPAAAYSQVILIESSGEPLGLVVNFRSLTDSGRNGLPNVVPWSASYFEVLSSNGYRYIMFSQDLDRFDGVPQGGIVSYWLGSAPSQNGLFYESEECSGQAYTLAAYPGFVFNATAFSSYINGNQPELWYAPKDEQLVQRSFVSWRDVNSQNTCVSFNSSGYSVRVFPNDPTVTGVSNVPPTPPFRLEPYIVESGSPNVFADRFENVDE